MDIKTVNLIGFVSSGIAFGAIFSWKSRRRQPPNNLEIVKGAPYNLLQEAGK